MSRQRTSEQPRRGIVERRQDPTTKLWWAELVCGHEEPANGLPDTASAVRCRSCLPVRSTPVTGGPSGAPGGAQ